MSISRVARKKVEHACCTQLANLTLSETITQIAVYGSHVERCSGVQHDQPSLQRSRPVVTKTVWLLDLHKA